MGSLSTFGTFTMARLGIYVSQHALNVTGNNISNINTEGYSRQNLDQSAMSFGGADRYQSRFDIRENGGVIARGVEQSRDKYLDIRYRNEQTRVGGMEKKLEGLDKLAVIFDEVGKGDDEEGVLEARFNDFVQQVELLASRGAGQDDFDSIARKSAEALVTQFNDYAKQLDTLYETEVMEFKDSLDSVNATLTKIRDLNDSIRMSEAFGGTALTQKDERNLLIDDLSKMIGIEVTYEKEDIGEGVTVDKLVIKLADDNDAKTTDKTLIDGIYGSQLELLNESNFDLGITTLRDKHQNPDPKQPNELKETPKQITKLLTDAEKGQSTTFPATEEGEAAVKEVAAVLNGDPKFYLDESDPDKAYYYHVSKETINGDMQWVIHKHPVEPYDPSYTVEQREANRVTSDYKYTVIESSKVAALGDTELSGGLQAMRELLTESGEYAKDEVVANVDPDAGTKRGIPYYQKALDTLAAKFAEIMNEANQLPDQTVYQMNGAGDKFVDANGTEIATKFVDDEGNVLTPPDPNGKYTVDDADRSKLVLKPEYNYYDGGVLFSNKGTNDDPKNITAANISISDSWAHGFVHMLRSTEPDSPSRGNENLSHFITLLTQDHDFTNGQMTQGTSKFKGTFQEMLTDTIAGTLGKDQNITKTMLDNYNATADELYVDRDAVMGVDLNDEAMNMMQFQKAYSAACRLMTTYDQMLDKLINGMAV